MNTIKSIFWKPTPEEQRNKCRALITANTRKLDRDIRNLKLTESKARQNIVTASKRAQRNPSQAKQAAKDTRLLARELIRVRKTGARLATSRAQLESVQMQVNEAFSVRKIQGSIKSSTDIMKDVNALVRMPELTSTMRELSQELVKAGIIEEMVGDSMPDAFLLEDEDEEAEAEVEKVLKEVLKKAQVTEQLPTEPAADVEEPLAEEDQEEMLDQMRGRLEALKS